MAAEKFVSCILCVAAEKFLESVEKNQNYSVLLLHLMDKQDADIHIRVSAAITFKNYVKRNWRIVSTNSQKSCHIKCMWRIIGHVHVSLI